jgi:hypothetical protein
VTPQVGQVGQHVGRLGQSGGGSRDEPDRRRRDGGDHERGQVGAGQR